MGPNRIHNFFHPLETPVNDVDPAADFNLPAADYPPYQVDPAHPHNLVEPTEVEPAAPEPRQRVEELFPLQDCDFSSPVTQQEFAHAAANEIGPFIMNYYCQSPDFVAALHNPSFQDNIIAAIANRQASHPYLERNIPSLFIMLASDRDILASMQERNAFDQLPDINNYVDYVVDRIKQGKLTDRDVVLLFNEQTAFDDTLFDHTGHLTHPGTKQMIQSSIPVTALDIREDYWQYCLSEREFDQIARQDKNEKAKMHIEKPLLDFIDGAEGNVFHEEKNINDHNIIAALGRFINQQSENWEYTIKGDSLIKEAFHDNKVKELALSKLRKIYLDYLRGGEYQSFPQSLQIMSDYTRECGGAGPLTQTESFLYYVGELGRSDAQVRAVSKQFEDKMSQIRLSNQEKTNYYDISTEVLRASPEIYKDLTGILCNLTDKSDFETFVHEIYPLFRAELAINANYEDKTNSKGKIYSLSKYDPQTVADLTRKFHNALVPLSLRELPPDVKKDALNKVKSKLFNDISKSFKTKFGLLSKSVPAMLTEEDARAVKDLTLYLGNLPAPTEKQKDYIGYFLALQFDNGKGWNDLRRGLAIPPGKVTNIVTAFNVSQALHQSVLDNPIDQVKTGIYDPDRLQLFRDAMQAETISIFTGTIEPTESKLKNLIGLFDKLKDPYQYQDGIDRDRITLLNKYHIKSVNRAIANFHQRLSGRTIPYQDGEQEITNQLIDIMKQNNITISPESVKTFFQDDLKLLGLPFAVENTLTSTDAAQKISDLTDLVNPPDQIISILRNLSEDHNVGSNPISNSLSLDYLESILVDHQATISDHDRQAVQRYIKLIRESKIEIDYIYDSIKKQFNKIHHTPSNDLVGKTIEQIDTIINGRASHSALITTCSGDMLTIIENIRACLSCNRKGQNNDTNLTFAEGYKFFLYSSETVDQEKSNSDEIVYLLPSGNIENPKMSFVMDKIYGIANTDVLMAHTENIIKKAKQLKHDFPEVNLSIIVPTSTAYGCGAYIKGVMEQLKTIDGLTVSEHHAMTVFLPPSGFGDHYIEFNDLQENKVYGPIQTYGFEVTIQEDLATSII